MKITNVLITDLKLAEYNPRNITEKQVADLKASIEKFGVVEPVVVNSNPERMNVIVGGHQRVRILKILGHTEVPVVYVNLDIDAEKELNVRLNKNTGGWDWDKLANEFDVDDLMSFGFTEHELGLKVDDDRDFSGDNKEITVGEIREGLGHTCPKCGFEFSDQK